MENTSKKAFWENIIQKYSSYEGSLIDFCTENNITKRQLYYHKNKFKNSNKPVFHAIDLKPIKNKNTNNAQEKNNNIRIEIGKANIIIPATEAELIKIILKELQSTC
ncbi:hypothetical protein SAMN05443428_105177 [Caloramator quimbayensis]|uniref:Transposase n=1 Tax=Caloramator quimbayensis TaxID=1147123 RepID=A0A1T4X2Z8_9CLOT|nr:hypothetical protein [Caloramator quimbayensis]SKA83809.1 hypothetical protein SAMN05443428_105177 [Caloramator quimbayensis]